MPSFAYRRLEPSEERAHRGRIAGDLATREARGRAGRDRTKDAALSKSVERGIIRGTAARQSTNDSRRREQKRDKRAKHAGETRRARETSQVTLHAGDIRW